MKRPYFIISLSAALCLAACSKSSNKEKAAGTAPVNVSKPSEVKDDDKDDDKKALPRPPWPTAKITDREKIRDQVDGGSVTIGFTVETTYPDAFTILCRAGNAEDLPKAEKVECAEEYEVADIADDVAHTFEIYALHKDTEAEILLESVVFTHEMYDVILVGAERLLTQRSGIIHLGITLNKPRPVYFICGAETSFYDQSMECRSGEFTVNLNRFSGGVYFTIGAYDMVTNKKLAEKNFPFCAGQICAQNVGLPYPPPEIP